MDREMRDDERYPTVVQIQDGSNAPEVSPYQTAPAELARDKAATPVPNKSPESAPIAAAFDNTGKEVVENGHHGAEPRKYCGMKRRTFLIVVAVVAIVLIGAIVGGVVGGLKAGEKSSDEVSEEEPPAPIFTGPIGAKERQLAVTNSNTPSPNIQLFYNDLATTDIIYRRIQNDKSGKEHKLELDIEPNWGSPIAASAWRVSNPLGIQIFYITNSTEEETNSNKTNIAQVTINCSTNTTGECDVMSNSIISTNITEIIHASSKLSSLRLTPTSIRVYFQGIGDSLLTMVGDEPSKNGWTSAALQQGDDAAASGSYFQVVGPESSNMHAWYVSRKQNKMKHFGYDDVLGPKTAPDLVDDKPGSGWSPMAAFSGVWAPKSNSWRVYTASPNKGSIVSYARDSKTTKWTPANFDEWGSVESGIAATAWNDQVRLYYFDDGKLVASALNTTVGKWAQPVSL